MKSLYFNILTIFPEFFETPLSCGLMGKAKEKGLINYSFINPREFTQDKHRSVDDRPYGGGPGMVMSVVPLTRVLESLQDPGKIILFTPQGESFDQKIAYQLVENKKITLICGRYEGIDARLEEFFPVHKISIGNFVLSGGEAAALCLIESVSRLLPDFMGSEYSKQEESFVSNLLEYPQYTRPPSFRGLSVPDVLLSGDHSKIAEWRRKQALYTTLKNRPDLLEQKELNTKDINLLKKIANNRLGRNLYIALLHYPVLNKKRQTTAVSLTNLDIHDISRICCSYSLGGYYLVTPLVDQQKFAQQLINHWQEGYGSKVNPDRFKAVKKVNIASDLEQVIEEIRRISGQQPVTIATSAQDYGSLHLNKVKTYLEQKPVLLIFGTGYGLSPQIMEDVDAVLRPIRYLENYNHLSVRSAVAITIDRVLGDYL